MNTTKQNIEATICYPFKVDAHNSGIIRGGWYDEMSGILVGMEARYVADALNFYAKRGSEMVSELEKFEQAELTTKRVKDMIAVKCQTHPNSFSASGECIECKTLTPEQVDEQIRTHLENKQDAFDFARATNLYLLAAREYGTALGGHNITSLLVMRTEWSDEFCKKMGDRVIDDPAIIKLIQDEGIPEAYDNGEG